MAFDLEQYVSFNMFTLMWIIGTLALFAFIIRNDEMN